MKILQVVNSFKPSWDYGGPARSVYEISKKLVENGNDVTVYTTDGYKTRLNVVKNKPVYVDGIKTYYFRNIFNYFTRVVRLPIPYFALLVVRKEIKNFDIIHIHEHRTILAVIVHHYAKKHGVPYIIQPRGSMPVFIKSRQKRLFDAVFGHAIINDASKIIASSKIESDQYSKVFPELDFKNVIYIPNGINLEDYQNLPEKGMFKDKILVDSNVKIILYLSRIHEIKGIDILIEAFIKLKNDFENVKLVIAGPDDGYLDKLKLIIKNLNIESEVIFPGPLYEKDKIEAYVDADVFVLPTRFDSFANVVLEACACGTPVVVTNNCGVSEWITDDVGNIVEYDKDQIANAIHEILAKDELNNIYNTNCNKFINNFTWNNIVKKIEDTYLECL